MKRSILVILVVIMVNLFAVAQTHSEKLPEPREEVIIFPNPATNVLNVLGLLNSQAAIIQISDASGSVITTYRWKIKNNAVNIPIASLEHGIYWVTIHTEQESVSKKFYKQ